MNIAALEKPVAETGEVADAPARPLWRRIPKVRLILAAVVILAVLAGVIGFTYWLVQGQFIQSTNNAYLKADQVALAPRVSGYVSEIYVSDNQDVAAGQPLLKIDARRYDAVMRQAQATADMRRADVAKAEADLRLQDARIAEAQADAEMARANAEFAEREFTRSDSLSHRGVVSAQKTDQMNNALSQARSTKALKDAALEAARQQLASLAAQLDQARAQLAAAQESLREAQMDLGDTILRSPVAGRVGDRSVRVGQFVQPGMRLLSVVPTGQLYLVANFKETQIARMRTGQPAVIHVDAFPSLALEGSVESFSPGTGAQFALLPPENATGNFTKIVQRVPVRIRVMSPPKGIVLVPGLSVEVSVNTKAHAPVRQAPAK